MTDMVMDIDLYDTDLVELASEELIARYNSGLAMLGRKPTSLTRFSLDMMGWSPEIAREKGNPYYLSHSFSNPTAIIITINQQNAPLCYPYHSFDQEMLTKIYTKYANQIMDINTTDALCLDLDNGISHYSTIDDLLLVDSFVLKAETPGNLLEKVRQQKELVDRFLESDSLWEEEKEREKLLKSGEIHGDLRYRDVRIDPLVFSGLDLFYTEALGGVYLFHDPRHGSRTNPLVLYRKRQNLALASSNKPKMRLMPVTDASLWRILAQEQYIEVNLAFYQKRPHLIDHKKEEVLADYACSVSDDYPEWSELQKKNFISEQADRIPNLYFELERLQKQIESQEDPTTINLSDNLFRCLAQPHKRIDVRYHGVIERLLSEMDPSDSLRLHHRDRHRFLEQYQKYSAAKKRWIKKHLNREQ